MRKFKLIQEHSQLGGVCAGLAYSLGVQTWILRFILLLFICSGLGVLPYLLIWALAPSWEETPKDYKELCE